MNYYLYVGDAKLGEENMGCIGRMILRGKVKSLGGAIKRGRTAWPEKTFTVHSFTNFYRTDTFVWQYVNIGDDA